MKNRCRESHFSEKLLHTDSPWEPTGPSVLRRQLWKSWSELCAFSSPVHLAHPQGLGCPGPLRGANAGACKTDPLMTRALFNPKFAEPGQPKQWCSELIRLLALHSFTQNLAGKMQFISRNGVIIPLAGQGAAVTWMSHPVLFSRGLP